MMPDTNWKGGEEPQGDNEGPFLTLQDCPADLPGELISKALAAAEKIFEEAGVDPLWGNRRGSDPAGHALYDETWNKAQAAIDQILGTQTGGSGPTLFLFLS